MAESTATTFNLSHELVKSWRPCTDGYCWFLGKFPQGGAYTAVNAALREDNQFYDAGWLFNNALAYALRHAPGVTADLAAGQSDEAAKLIEATSPAKLNVPSSDDVNVTTENDNGDDCVRIGSSGNDARINATGDRAAIACAGIGAHGKAGKDGALALAYWDESADRPRFAVGYVGENIEADTWYSVNGAGVFVKEWS